MVAGHFPVELTGHSGHANAQTLKNIERDNGFSFFKTGREQQGNILILINSFTLWVCMEQRTLILVCAGIPFTDPTQIRIRFNSEVSSGSENTAVMSHDKSSHLKLLGFSRQRLG